LSAATKNRYLRTLRSIFKLGIRRGWLKENPSEKVDFEHHEKGQTETLSNEAIDGMLSSAKKAFREYFREWKKRRDAKLKAEEVYYIPQPKSSPSQPRIPRARL
jgi:site-specific recombinase XerD